MAKDFVKLSEVTVLEEVTDSASVLVEQNGEIYRAPKTQVGGAGGIKTAIIRDSEYLNMIAGVQSTQTAGITFECINMTFEEAYETMANGEPLNVVGMLSAEGGANVHGLVAFVGNAIAGIPCIIISFFAMSKMIVQLFWTADGLSTEPLGGNPPV